jgi:hypothetical protein
LRPAEPKKRSACSALGDRERPAFLSRGLPRRIERAPSGGLWTLEFGVGGSNGDPNTLYFTDGINGEANVLFSAIFANGNGS